MDGFLQSLRFKSVIPTSPLALSAVEEMQETHNISKRKNIRSRHRQERSPLAFTPLSLALTEPSNLLNRSLTYFADADAFSQELKPGCWKRLSEAVSHLVLSANIVDVDDVFLLSFTCEAESHLHVLDPAVENRIPNQ